MLSLRLILRVGVCTLWGVCLLLWLGVTGTWGGHTAFDDDYIHCPSKLRLPALSGVEVSHTEERDLIVAWQPPAYRNFTALITARLTGSDYTATQQALLGVGTLRFPAPPQGSANQELTLTLAVTDRGHVISDLYTQTLTRDLAAPSFRTPFRHVAGGAVEVTQGHFYYVGFQHNFTNGYVDTGRLAPATPRFRVGVRHGSAYDPDVFARFRLRLEDGEGRNLLGFDAASQAASALYAGKVLVLGSVDGDPPRPSLADPGTARFGTLAPSGRLAHPAPVVWQSPVTSPYWALADAPVIAEQAGGTAGRGPLLFSNLLARTALAEGDLYAEPPDHVFNLPPDLFDREDTRYTLTVWAEAEGQRRISAPCRLTFSTQVRQRGDALYTNVWGYDPALGVNRHDTEVVHAGAGRVLSLRLHAEDCDEADALPPQATPTPTPSPQSAPAPAATPVPATATPTPTATATPATTGTLSLSRSSNPGPVAAAWSITGTCMTATLTATPSGGSGDTRTLSGTSGTQTFSGILFNNNAVSAVLTCDGTNLASAST